MTIEGPRPEAPGAPAADTFPETSEPRDDGSDASGSLPAEQLVGPEAAEGSDEDVTHASDDVDAEEGAGTDL